MVVEKARKYGLRKRRVRWSAKWLKVWAERLVIGVPKSRWRQVSSGVGQDSDLGPAGLNTVITDVGSGTKCPLSKL